MHVQQGLRHCLIDGGEMVGRDQQAIRDWGGGCPPKVKAAPEGALKVGGGESYA